MTTQTLPSTSRILEITIPALIVFAVSWGIYTSKSNAQEIKIQNLEAKYETLLEMKTDIEVIKNDMGYVKRALNIKE